MSRTVAVIWHALFSIAAGVLYFLFVLPRWWELSGDTSHTLGTVLRIVAGALIGLAALPVVFTWLRTRRPEYGTPQLALRLRLCRSCLHVLAGVLIIGTAISEIWFSLDDAGRWLFGIYGAAAAISLLGFFSFYLAFIAELPPPPPRPLKKKERKSRWRRRKGDREAEPPSEGEDDRDRPKPTRADGGEPVTSTAKEATRTRPTSRAETGDEDEKVSGRPRRPPTTTRPRPPRTHSPPSRTAVACAINARRASCAGPGCVANRGASPSKTDGLRPAGPFDKGLRIGPRWKPTRVRPARKAADGRH